MRGRRPIDISGQRFGRLVAIREAGRTPKGGALWECVCDCGNRCVVRGTCLRSGQTRSCRCFMRDRIKDTLTTHGHAGKTDSCEYRAWAAMINRCENMNDHSWNRYGGRGISVCQRWRQSFVAFLEDVGSRPSPQHSLDRFPDNNGHYEPGNVRWATAKEQTRNRHNNRILEYDGRVQCMAAWAEELGLDYKKFKKRIAAGWTIEQSMATP